MFVPKDGADMHVKKQYSRHSNRCAENVQSENFLINTLKIKFQEMELGHMLILFGIDQKYNGKD